MQATLVPAPVARELSVAPGKMVDVGSDPLAVFSPATATWFREVFARPTAAQAGAWQAVAAGENALVVAPTGSGKTLAAFLWALDDLTRSPVPSAKERCRVLYVSPLKALAVDVERNLRAPLAGITQTALRLDQAPPNVTVGVRSGDTSAADRRALVTRPPDILITTPESLFLMLTSAARDLLRSVRTVIVDEVHALAGTKRGAHLALSLERLEALTAESQPPDADGVLRPLQRIGLSATVRPAERVAAYLGGSYPVRVVAPPAEKAWDLSIVVPVEDMSDLAASASTPAPPPSLDDDRPPPRTPSIWPHVENRILDVINAHRSTIVFANSRRLAERLTAHLNELQAERLGEETAEFPPPAEIMAQSGASSGRDGTTSPVIARAHHGSVSKEQRAQIENDLKSGQLPCVVATSSLELGIDMGAVDVVVQVEAPPSVASGLQRVGRAGHQVGATSRGVFFPNHRGDLVESAVVVERMRQGAIEEVAELRNPLDVLAQQIVAIVAIEETKAEELYALVRRASSFRELPHSAFEAVLDMLSGRYPSEDFAELRPRLVWQRDTGLLTARPGAQRLAVTSGGTIPDRGLFGVFLVGEGNASGKHAPGRRVGELDEEMVYETRVGDVFTLGTTSWRVEQITHDQVLVSPAPGSPGRLPFWKGDAPGRPLELGRAYGEFVRELGSLSPPRAEARLREAGLDEYAARNLASYLAEQQAATGTLPTDKTIVVERFRDELGDWRVCMHCGLGTAVLAPWALAVEQAARQRYGMEVQATATNDGIVLRIPDTESEPPSADLMVVDPELLESVVTDEVGGSALFAARFRESAARALLLPRRDPKSRSPLWQQRMRSAQLLTVAAQYPEFPIVLETMRECLTDVFDLDGLLEVQRQIAGRAIRLVEVETKEPSPFARSLLFGYVGAFVYEGDVPLAEKKAAALALDATLLAELLGKDGLKQLLDAGSHRCDRGRPAGPERGAAGRHGRSSCSTWSGPRAPSPATRSPRRCRPELDWRCGRQRPDRATGGWSRCGSPAGRCSPWPRTFRGSATGWASRCRPGWPPRSPSRRPIRSTTWCCAGRGPTGRSSPPRWPSGTAWAGPWSRTPAGPWSARAPWSPASFVDLPGPLAAERTQYCHAQVLSLIKRRTLGLLRQGVEPVEPVAYARFLAEWQGARLTRPRARRGAVGDRAALRLRDPGQRAGVGGPPGPGGQLQPGDARRAHLGRGDLLGRRRPDRRERRLGALVRRGPGAARRPTSNRRTWRGQELLAALGGGGAYFFDALLPSGVGVSDRSDYVTALWDLVWAGLVTGDTFAPVRRPGQRRCPPAGPPARRPHPPRPAGRGRSGPAGPDARESSSPTTAGRWSLVVRGEVPAAARLAGDVFALLDRYGVVTRGSVLTESSEGGFGAAYRALSSPGGVRPVPPRATSSTAWGRRSSR